jgi:hypothetical protein
MSNPEWNILNRTKTEILRLVSANTFVAAPGERVRSVIPMAVEIWSVPEAGRTDGVLQDLIMPGILISALSVESTLGAGLNCADDEVHRIAIQIVDSQSYNSQRGPIQTYGNWMNRIRSVFTAVPNPFLQDADPNEYDPFVVHPLKRLPAEAQSLIRHDQQVSMFTFQVMVRHHR